MKIDRIHGAGSGIDEDWVAAARALTPLLDEAGPRIDATRSLPAPVLDALHGARMFRMLLPRSVGGAELSLPTFFRVMLALAEGDASAAWSVSQSNGCALSAGYMDPAAAREVFGDPRAVLSWGFPAGPCSLRAVEGGWRVTGTWGFGSGSRHSTWVGGHSRIVDDKGVPQRGADGQPLERTALMPRSAVTVVDDQWNVIGLRGTGSDTYAARDLFVPARFCIVPRGVGRDLQASLDEPQESGQAPGGDSLSEPERNTEREPERREAGPLYRFSPTAVYQTGFAAVALGIARAMLESFIELAARKAPSGTGVTLRDNAVIQQRVAVSRARLDSTTAWLAQSLQASWDGCVANGCHALDDRMRMRLASTFAIREAAQVVEKIYSDAGATAIFEANPFERRLRDMHAAAQQIQAQAAHLQTVGQYYLGLKPDTRFI